VTADLTLEAPRSGRRSAARGASGERRLGLVILWSHDEPHRVGEVALVPQTRGATWVIGRDSSEGRHRLSFIRQRPGENLDTGQLRSARISRGHLLVSHERGALHVQNAGKLDVRCNGQIVSAAMVQVGDLLEIDDELLLMVAERPERLPRLEATGPFGEADADGLVGESPAAWELRRQVVFCSAGASHVLVRGPSGAGKELVAQAIHRASNTGRELVARNAATFPEGILDAELFGNLRDYPNPGMAARPGVVGEADGSTLFLDEIGETSHAMQAHLLRVLDSGEYQRLGESRRRRSRFRLIGATNRPVDALKHDFLARLTQRIEVPGLDQRREDIPLVARHLLLRMATEHPHLFPDGAPRPRSRLLYALVTRPYTTHVREVQRLLWEALDAWSGEGGGPYLDLPPSAEVRTASRAAAHPHTSAERADLDPRLSASREQFTTAWHAHGGDVAAVGEALGISRRTVFRLKKRYLQGQEDADRAR